MQTVISTEQGYDGFLGYLRATGMNKILVVCGNSCSRLDIGKYLDEQIRLGKIDTVYFRDFAPNPD